MHPKEEILEWFLWLFLPIILIIPINCQSTIDGTSSQNIIETTSFQQQLTTEAPQNSAEIDDLCLGNCSSLPASCYRCNTSNNCTYGTTVPFFCEVIDGSRCEGNRTVAIDFQCRYCFLTTPNEEHTCLQTNTTCKVAATPLQKVKGNCTVHENVFCLGQRRFTKMMPCSWTSGYSWSTALALSITVGGFGADRFYLGYWREGLGKFFSFGGLGVWTLIDVVLIGSGYLGPSDGSLYVN